MTLTRFLRHAGIVAAATLLVTSICTSSLYAQSAGGSPTNADGTPATKPVAKKKVAKPSAEKPQKPAQNTGSGAVQGYRPDPISSY
jgi:hypothetical protein